MDINKHIGSFIPTTSVYDVQQVYNVEDISPALRELMVRLYQNLNIMAIRVNQSISGYHSEREMISGVLFYPSKRYASNNPISQLWRQGYIKVITFGALPAAAGSISVAHGIKISAMTTFFNIEGAATNPSTSFIPLPYASPVLNQNISVEVTATDVVITVGIDRSAYTSAYVVLQYLQQ